MNRSPSSSHNYPAGSNTTPVWQQHTLPQPVMPQSPGRKQPVTQAKRSVQTQTTTKPPVLPPVPDTPGPSINPQAPNPVVLSTKKRLARVFILGLIVALTIAIYSIWNSASTSPTSATDGIVTQSNSVTLPQSTSNMAAFFTSTPDGGTITVYITGAVHHPGVYTLPTGARIYQLVQAAGGTTANADLTALNMATKLSDGQEIYVLQIGETPPYTGGSGSSGSSGNTGITSSASGTSGTSGTSNTSGTTGGLVNINTASETEMRQVLHVSSATAQKIIDYRTQNGPYTSTDQLLQVISRSIYDRIKNMVTVS